MTYRLFVDEVGNDKMSRFEHATNRFLSLSGIIMDADVARQDLYPGLERLKAQCFAAHPDEALVVLHRREIVVQQGHFAALRDPVVCGCFEEGLLDIFTTLPYLVITATIDKLAHSERYEVWRYNPYHYCMQVLLERYVMELDSRHERGDVAVESRDKKNDKALKQSYRFLWEHGTGFGFGGVSAQDMQTRLTSREVKLSSKPENMAGLQMVDLIAKPCHDLMLSQKGHADRPENLSGRIVSVLVTSKYRRSLSGQIMGWGQKWLP